MTSDRLAYHLAIIESLLKEDGQPYAKIISNILKLHKQDEKKFIEALTYDGLWGRMGSLDDRALKDKQKNKEFNFQIICLADEMEKIGAITPLIREVSEITRKWYEKGAYDL